MRAAWLLALASTGCAYRVALTSQPMPVEVTLPDGRVVATPAEVDFRWVPFGHQWVTVRSPDHRTLEVDLRRREIRWFRFVGGTIAHPATLTGRPRGEVRFVLVPEHGPAGTWTEPDLE